jgi:5-methyltetrahydropteroyltriglutamate--homocysteine methyltransferase
VQRSTDHILTTHSGSLLRPRPVLKLMKAIELHQPVDETTFDKTVAAGIAEVVEDQVRIGVDVVGDGEVGRLGFARYMHERLGGFEPRTYEASENAWGTFTKPDVTKFADYYAIWQKSFRLWWTDPEVPLDDIPNVPGLFERFNVTGPVHYKGQEVIKKDVNRLKSALQGHENQIADAFMTATSPTTQFGGDPNLLKQYPTYEAFLYDLADACAEEYKAIVDAGFVLQIDWPSMQNVGWYRLTNPTAEREELDKAAELAVEALNHSLRDIPEEKVRFHYCSGSGLRPHTDNPSLREGLLPLILKVKAQAYGIEGASARHGHEWMVFKDFKLPEGKILIPGVIAQNYQVVEHPELVAWRIENWASVVGKENVIAGIDCGFSQHWDARQTVPSVQWAKFESLVEGAALASKKLWNN